MDFSRLSADTAQRFRTVSKLIRIHSQDLSEEPRLLDVGGYPGTFAREFVGAFPRWKATTVDKVEEKLPNYVSASGAKLPFEDNEFEVVTSIDTLEHIPQIDRLSFINELCRVSSHTVILAAPFHHPATVAIETLLDATHEKVFRVPHPWLHEHVENVLPRLDEIMSRWPGSCPLIQIEKSYDLLAWMSWQAMSMMRKLEGQLDKAWSAFDRQLADIPTPSVSDVPYRYLLVARKNGKPVNFKGGILPSAEAGKSTIELARFYCRMLETLAEAKVQETAGPGALKGSIEGRLKEVIAMQEEEIARLKGVQVENSQPISSTASRVSNSAIKIIKMFQKDER